MDETHCKHCGRCKSCGKPAAIQPLPYWPYLGQPIWIVPTTFPVTYPVTYTFAINSNTTSTQQIG